MGEFPSGKEDESSDGGGGGRFEAKEESMGNWDEVGQSLAGAGFRVNRDILTGQDRGDCCGLHRGHARKGKV